MPICPIPLANVASHGFDLDPAARNGYSFVLEITPSSMAIAALFRGLVLGFVAGIPVGPVNAAVIDTAMRKCFHRALAIGVGGAFVDFIYALVACAGLVPLLTHAPEVANALIGIGGVVLVIFGILTAKKAAVAVEPPNLKAPVVSRALLGAFAKGALITVANPSALVSWILIAGTLLADLTLVEAAFASIGIFLGTSLWFWVVAWLATKGRVNLGERSVWITRTVGVLLVLYGIFLVGKASVVVWAANNS